MRGIEGALVVLQEVREGKFASESLRALGNRIPVKELSLASSLAYMTLRREPLWRRIFGAYVRKTRAGKPQALAPLVSDCLLLGTAGLLELRHFAQGVLVNGLLEILKEKGQAQAVPMVNAILHNVNRDGGMALDKLRRSPRLEERALWAGIPDWMLPAWKKSWSGEELNQLFELMQTAPRSSLRTSPGGRDEVLKTLKEEGMDGEPSDLFPDSIRLSTTVLPTLVPGFERGLATVQTEGSMLVASLAAEYGKELFHGEKNVLDMCSGRGIKAGQIAQSLPGARLECWELSSGKHHAAAREMERLGIRDRVELRLGDALSLFPSASPEIVFLDVPCSGSGTWNRKPESKWKLSWAKLDKLQALQGSLLRRALTLARTGGIIIYATCSLLRQENENIVAEALMEHPEFTVLSPSWSGEHVRQGRPWGTYIWPSLPWLDGFYVAIIMKRAEA